MSKNQKEAKKKKGHPYYSHLPDKFSVSSESDDSVSEDFFGGGWGGGKRGVLNMGRNLKLIDKIKKSLPKGKQHYLTKGRYYSPKVM